ncbi:MAG: hypothetical protein GX248_09550 [Peptococcaceae bacterium]|nr:hypothetical protein [Peptococcaceae bacterium]
MLIMLWGAFQKIRTFFKPLNTWPMFVKGLGLFLVVVMVLFYILYNSFGSSIKDNLTLKASLEQELTTIQAEQQSRGARVINISRLPEAIGFVEQSFEIYALEVKEITITRPNYSQWSAETGSYFPLGLKVTVTGEQQKMLQALLDISLNEVYLLTTQEIDVNGTKANILLQLLVYQD